MRRMIVKSFIIQMIGVIISGYTFFGFNPVAIGYFGAVHSLDIVRWPAIFVMGGGMLLQMEPLMAAKCIIMMGAIEAIILFIENGKNKNANAYFSAMISGLVLTAVEMADAFMGTYDYSRIIMNLAAGVLTFSISVISAKALEILMIPDGDLVAKSKKNTNSRSGVVSTQSIHSTHIETIRSTGKLKRFANSLERLSQSVDEIVSSDEVGASYENENVNMQLWQSRIEESRRAIAVQLKEMAFMINEFSKEEYEFESLEKEREHFIKIKLKSRGIALNKVALLKNRRGILEVVITVKGTKGRVVTFKEFIGILEEGFGHSLRPMGEYKRLIGSEEVTYNFTEETNFMVINGAAKAVKGEESISGDNFAFMELCTGQALMSLSDGMGSGLNAYKDSEMVIELLEELLDCGFSEEVALKLINSVFMVNAENVSPATIDMGIIDMYSGICDFVKLGAASTFVKRGRWVEVIKSTSLPMGVFDSLDMESTSKKLYNGDFVIMVSDGILDSIPAEDKEGWLSEVILETDSRKPKELADSILKAVIEENNNQAFDDMTVLVTGVWDRCA